MHVLHVVTSSRFAGVERHVAHLAAAQADAGHRVSLVGGPPLMTRAAGRSVRVRPAATAGETLAALRSLPERPDVVNAHMTSSEVLALLQYAGRRPVVATRHFAAPRGSTAVRRGVLGAAPHLLAAQVSVSGYVAQAIGQPSRVVHAGLPVRPAYPVGDAREVVVLSRLEREKRVDVAIDAFAASGLAGEGWTLVIAGDGARRDELVARARQQSVGERVRFCGHVDDVDSVLGRGSMLLAPCPVEALGMAVLEAMAVGRPAIAAASGGHVETVGAVRPDLTFAPGDVDGAAHLLRKLAHDPVHARTAGEQLRAHQQAHFTAEQQVRETDAVYGSVL